MSIRTEKVASVIKKALANPLNELSRDIAKGSLISITGVVMSKDLSLAKVYLSIFGSKQSPLQIIHILDDNAPQLRSSLAGKIHLKAIPELRFYLDDTLDQMEQIQKLIDKTKGIKSGDYKNEDYK